MDCENSFANKITVAQLTTRLSGFPIREDYSLIQLKADLQSLSSIAECFSMLVASSRGNNAECHTIMCTLYNFAHKSL